MSFGCQLSCLTPANKVCSFIHKDLFLALCNTRASTEENSQFQYSEAAARQWGWEPALINAELIYNLMLKGRQGSRGCTPESPVESGLASRGSKGLRSSLEPGRGSLGAL